MPKISDAKRDARRAQILEAAWTNFQRRGLHATTMDDIIRTSGLSAGAVYSYYPSKEDLIFAAVTSSLSGLRLRLEPILESASQLPPDQFVGKIAEAISAFTARDGYDLKRIALLGWSEAQRNERLRETMQTFYRIFRDRLTEAAENWRQAGVLRERASARDVAKVILAEILGFVVQAAILGEVEPKHLAKGIRALMSAGAIDTS
ncbi:transcriptional regulator, TetR family [Methylocella silvestris BL2]|uniref:Transcriptional regulator, TetR family n=1 Tax=Methylocella silvestris (strain DSM 15510 / CIP 108128 / LMG 27833 / NCIMB 13906 / BL2) TaxID=395965 RepID=B8EQS5_METSB|nr:TetR/AcrR family transcriptional regulator [Methylocella silvestris]ACK49346.1 transcriptional regulator, TetR family [Methylocella silvestris BL2]